MKSAVCARVEAAFRDSENPGLGDLPTPIFLSLRLHQINAFGYRPTWAQELLPYLRFSEQGRPYFPMAPETPEAHRHKFLCALALSEDSPGRWELGGRSVGAEDFVDPILAIPVEDWGDHSIVPEPSWTLQFLSAFLDEKGRWRGQETSLAAVAQKYWDIYFQDFASQELWQPGRTPFTETGLHFLEAINKLCLRQSSLAPLYLGELTRHLGIRLEKALEESSVLLGNPGWIDQEYRDRVLGIAISQLLVLGHLLEVCFHPRGALRGTWEAAEKRRLAESLESLAQLMELFFDPRILNLMTAEQRRAYPFPLLHAYHAQVLGG